MKLMLILVMSINLAFSQEFIPIKSGEPSPVDGYVISINTEKKLRAEFNLLEKKVLLLTDLTVKQNELIEFQKKHIEIQRNYNDELKKQVNSDNFWFKTGYFVLGAFVTGMVSYGTFRAIK